MQTMDMYYSELSLALGDDRSSLAVWYPPGPFQLLKQKTHVGQDPTYNSSAKDTISFVDANGKLAMLDEMLPESNVRQDWEVPWTSDDTVGQKMHIRVLISTEEDANVVDCQVTGLINVRGFQSVPQPITKAKLGSRIAKVLKESEEFMTFCEREGYAFEGLAIRQLKNVAKGSWQPELYIKTH